MEMKVFKLCKTDAILLYGETPFAKETYARLQDMGYNVMGYIDQRYAGCFEGEGHIKTGLDGIDLLRGGKTGLVVIICLQNGMQHEKAAELLSHKGISRIIYLPMGLGSPLRAQELHRRAYRHMLEFRYEKIKEIPVYEADGKSLFIIIAHEEDEVSFWCPVRYLRSADVSMVEKSVPENLMTAKTKLIEYADVGIGEHRPYMELFKYLQGKDSDIDIYLTAMGRIMPDKKEELLADRKCLYKVYEQAFHYNMQFFADSPAKCIWNKKGWFNVKDGMHRIQYLYSKGYREAPITVSTAEYEHFLRTLDLSSE